MANTAAGVVCLLCDPRATAATTTYCAGCSPSLPRPTWTPPEPSQPEVSEDVRGECSGCGERHALADGLCLLCRLKCDM